MGKMSFKNAVTVYVQPGMKFDIEAHFVGVPVALGSVTLGAPERPSELVDWCDDCGSKSSKIQETAPNQKTEPGLRRTAKARSERLWSVLSDEAAVQRLHL